jgi:F-type H+-transporting ATPase subunit gamma
MFIAVSEYSGINSRQNVMDTLESLRTKIESAADIRSVVKTMKAVAASNIGQYEKSVAALGDYFQTVALGLAAWFSNEKKLTLTKDPEMPKKADKSVAAIVFGSDQGLVGRFNDSLTDFVTTSLEALPGKKEIWSVGERIQLLLSDSGFNTTALFNVPNEVDAITGMVGEILVKAQLSMEKEGITSIYIFHNQPKPGAGYSPTMQLLLPLNEKWRSTFYKMKWPSNKNPQVAGGLKSTLKALIREYLFMSLFKACAESLASENSSRLSAMQRAEKNIDELLENLNSSFHRLRQSSIDEELFDVVSGFEALKKEK